MVRGVTERRRREGGALDYFGYSSASSRHGRSIHYVCWPLVQHCPTELATHLQRRVGRASLFYVSNDSRYLRKITTCSFYFILSSNRGPKGLLKVATKYNMTRAQYLCCVYSVYIHTYIDAEPGWSRSTKLTYTEPG